MVDILLPERRLMAAVLAVALIEYQEYVHASDPKGRCRFAEVNLWFASGDTRWPFSFMSICAALGLDPSLFRGGGRASHDCDTHRRMRQLKPGAWHS